MLERTFDVERVNAIANHPGVRPGLGYEGDLDFSGAVSDRRNVFLLCEGGCGLFDWAGPEIYQGHLMFLPGHRGREALRASAEMAEYMFAGFARILFGQPPAHDRATAWHLRQIGFRPAGEGVHPMIGPVRYFVKERDTCRLS